MDYTLALTLAADTRGLTVGLNAAAQNVRQFGNKTEQSFRGAEQAARNAAKTFKDDWTKAARDAEAAERKHAAARKAANEAGSKDQKKQAQDAVRESQKAMQQASRHLDEVRRVRHEAAQEIGRGMLIASAALTVGLGATLNVTRNFNAEISRLGAVADASGKELGNLREAVLKAGQASVYSSTEAAKGAQELAKAGVAIDDIIGGALIGSLNLAASDQIALAEAAEIAATALSVWKLEGTQMNHVADLMAAGAGKAQGGVRELGFALQQSALVAKQFGISLDDTIAGLTMFASNGLMGSDAGTSFRTMLLRLNPQSQAAAGVMKELGLEFYDAQGQFVGLEETARQLHDALGDASDQTRSMALNTIFGQDAIRAANILVNEGAEGFKKWAGEVDDFGFAARQAEKNMDNLNGDIERLKGSMEVALIGTGDQASGVLREMVQTVDLLVGAYNELPDGIQGAVVAFGGLTAATSGAIGVLSVAVPKYKQLQETLMTMGSSGAQLATALRVTTIGLGLAGAAAAAGLIVYGQYVKEKAEAKAVTDSFTEALRAERDGQEGASNAAIAAELHKRKLNETMKQVGVAQSDYLALLRGDENALARVTDTALRHNTALEYNSKNYVLLRDALSGNRVAFRDLLNQNEKAFLSTNKQGTAIRKLIGAQNDLSPKLKQAIKDSQDEAKAKKEMRDSALELGRSLNLSGGELESFGQKMSGQSDDLGKLAAELNFTREQLVELGNGSEEMAEAIAKNIKSAVENTKKSFGAFSDVIGKFGGQQSVAAGDIKKFYRETIKQSEEFTRNIQSAIRRGLDPELTSRLLQAGPEQAGPILKTILSDHSGNLIKMTNESENKLREISSLAVQLARITNLAVNERNDQMALDSQKAMQIVQMAYENGGTISAQKLAEKLEGGLVEAKRITDLYGLSVVTGFNEVRKAFDQAPISAESLMKNPMNYTPNWRQSRLGQRYADGGIEDHTAQIATGQTPVRIWAEPETGGEAYIPLSPTKRQRSTEILHTVAGHFGLDVVDPRNGGSSVAFASGGIYGVYPPNPPRGPGAVSQAMYAGANHQYKLLEMAYKQMQALPGGGWQAITAFLNQAGVPFTVTSTTGGRHAPGSYHYCVPMDTEILTRSGWKKYHEVEVGDETIGYNPETGKSEWTEIKEVVRFDDAEVVEAKHSRMSIRCTPNHRWIVEGRKYDYAGYSVQQEGDLDCPECGGPAVTTKKPVENLRGMAAHRRTAHGVNTTYGKDRKRGKATVRTDRERETSLIEFKDIKDAQRIRLAASADTVQQLPISIDEVRIIAWAVTDGWINRTDTATKGVRANIRLYQKKKEFVAEIDDLTSAIPVRRYEHTKDGVIGWYFPTDYSTELIKRAELHELSLTQFVLALGTEEREAFLDACRKAEGSVKGGYRDIAQYKSDVREAIEVAAALCGYQTASSERGVRLRRECIERGKLVVSPLSRQQVWCVVTELGTWTMRQNEQVMLTGNSGKAVDLVGPNMFAIFKTLERAVGSLSELFFDSVGYSYKRGQRIKPIGGHADHVHAATYDAGGWIKPGLNVVRNTSGRPEPVFTADQFDRLIEAVSGGGRASVIVQAKAESIEELSRKTVRKLRR